MLDDELKELGRRPFELKVGDIVENGQNVFVEVTDFSKTGKTIYIKDHSNIVRKRKPNECWLVCPREWRVN